MRQINIEGYSPDEILGLPDEQLDALAGGMASRPARRLNWQWAGGATGSWTHAHSRVGASFFRRTGDGGTFCGVPSVFGVGRTPVAYSGHEALSQCLGGR